MYYYHFPDILPSTLHVYSGGHLLNAYCVMSPLHVLSYLTLTTALGFILSTDIYRALT